MYPILDYVQIVKINRSFLKLGVETKLKQVRVRFDKTDLLIISEFELGNDQNTPISTALDNGGIITTSIVWRTHMVWIAGLLCWQLHGVGIM